MENVVAGIIFGIPLVAIVWAIAVFIVGVVAKNIGEWILVSLGSKTYWEAFYKKTIEKKTREIEKEKEKEYNDKLRAALTEFYEKEHEKKEDEDIVQKV